MKVGRIRRPSPALIVALVALVAAMSGAAIALPGKNSVTSNDIKKNAVRSTHIKKNAVRAKHVKNDSLSEADIGDYAVIDATATATEAGSEAAARSAAPEIPLWTDTTLDIYGKCFRDDVGGVIFAETYARTTADGALLEGDDDLPGFTGATLLETTTLEVDRQLDTQNVSAADAAAFDEAEEALMSAGGDQYHVLTHLGAKQGTLAGGDGAFGPGNVCTFGGAVFG